MAVWQNSRLTTEAASSAGASTLATTYGFDLRSSLRGLLDAVVRALTWWLPGSGPREPAVAVALVGVAVAMALGVLAGCGSGGGGSEASWLQPNADRANTRVASPDIDSENVNDLNIPGTQALTGSGPFGAFASTPLISEDGVTYVQDLASNVMAYDLETGEQLWRAEGAAPPTEPDRAPHQAGATPPARP